MNKRILVAYSRWQLHVCVQPRKHPGACNSEKHKSCLLFPMLTTCPCRITLLQHSPLQGCHVLGLTTVAKSRFWPTEGEAPPGSG